MGGVHGRDLVRVSRDQEGDLDVSVVGVLEETEKSVADILIRPSLFCTQVRGSMNRNGSNAVPLFFGEHCLRLTKN